MSQQPQRPWTTKALADAAHVTQRHLLRLFTEHAGVSPSAYVELIRLEHARRALAGGATPRVRILVASIEPGCS